MTDLQAALEDYRRARFELETSLLPVATSVDGHSFDFQVSLHGLELEPGGYVAIDAGDSSHLGQILSLELRHQDVTGPGLDGQVRVRAGGGIGVVLQGDGRRSTTPSCGPPLPTRWQPGSTGAARGRTARVGELALAPGCPVPARRRWLRPPHLPVRPVRARARRTRWACCSSDC